MRRTWWRTGRRSMTHNKSGQPWIRTVCPPGKHGTWHKRSKTRANACLCKTDPDIKIEQKRYHEAFFRHIRKKTHAPKIQ